MRECRNSSRCLSHYTWLLARQLQLFTKFLFLFSTDLNWIFGSGTSWTETFAKCQRSLNSSQVNDLLRSIYLFTFYTRWWTFQCKIYLKFKHSDGEVTARGAKLSTCKIVVCCQLLLVLVRGCWMRNHLCATDRWADNEGCNPMRGAGASQKVKMVSQCQVAGSRGRGAVGKQIKCYSHSLISWPILISHAHQDCYLLESLEKLHLKRRQEMQKN